METRTIARHWRPYLVLFCFVVLLARSFWGDRTLYWGDLALYFEPMYGLMQSRLRAGHIPLWNPYILCGQPLLGNPQMNVFYPTTLLLALSSTWNMIRFGCGVHLWLCGVFTYHYLMRWFRHVPAALSGAMVFVGSACLLGRLQFPPMIFAATFLPLLLLYTDAILDSRAANGQIGLTVATGLMLLAAHPHVAYLALLCCLTYAGARMLRIAGREPLPELRRIRAWRLGRSLLVPLGLGVALAAVQLLPALQVMLESPRERLTPGQANRFMLDPSHLLTLIWPHFLGHPSTRDYWGPGNVWEPAVFIGWLPLLLIGYAWARAGAAPFVRYWLLLVGVCVWLAMGVNAGLYVVAFYLLPGLGKFHDPARLLIPATFGAAALTCAGFDALRRNWAWYSDRVGAAILVGLAVPLLWYAPDWLPTARLASVELHRSALPLDAEAGRLYLPAHEVISRNYISAGYTDYGDNGTRGIGAMLDTLMPNLNMNRGVESASGYEPVPLRGAAALDALARAAFRRDEPNFVEMMRIMNVSSVVVPGSVHLHLPLSAAIAPSNQHYRTLRLLQIREHKIVWLTRRVRRVEGETRIGAFLDAPSFNPNEIALVSDDMMPGEPDLDGIVNGMVENERVGDERVGGEPEPPGAVIRQRRVQLSGETLAFDLDAGRTPAYVVISVAAFPGWNAVVDGVPVTLHRTDGAILGLFVNSGPHHIELKYTPVCYFVGLYVSLCALVMVICLGVRVICARRAGKRKTRSNGTMDGATIRIGM
jgi:hypothetical protein